MITNEVFDPNSSSICWYPNAFSLKISAFYRIPILSGSYRGKRFQLVTIGSATFLSVECSPREFINLDGRYNDLDVAKVSELDHKFEGIIGSLFAKNKKTTLIVLPADTTPDDARKLYKYNPLWELVGKSGIGLKRFDWSWHQSKKLHDINFVRDDIETLIKLSEKV